MYAEEDRRVPLTLKKRLQEMREELVAGVVAGIGVTDFAEYKFRLGRIAGLDEAIKSCAEIEQDLNG